jgi:anti-sigma regulatory factor (Ser/Thr protein kinase)
MFKDLDFVTMEAQVSPLKGTWTDRVVPGKVEILFDNRYSPGYAWMYSYEKRLKYRIEEALDRRLGSVERKLFGPDAALSEGLSNAFVHGNHRNPNLPIEVHTAVGQKGLAFSIRDQGTGFDVTSTIRDAERNSRKLYHIAGNGMRALLKSEDIVICYTDGGSTLNLMLDFASLSCSSGSQQERTGS